MALGLRRPPCRRTSGSAALVVVAAGIGNGAAVVCNALLVQRGAPDRLRGRASPSSWAPATPSSGLGWSPPAPSRTRTARARPGGSRRASAALGALAGFVLLRGDDRAERRGECAAGKRLSSRLDASTRSSTASAAATGARSRGRSPSSRPATRSPTSSSASSIPRPGRRTRVGITGPPGVGKSSLVSALVRHVRARRPDRRSHLRRPLEPVHAGALLGDRIRLADHFLDPGVFIRSMGTRGHLGGLAEATLQAALSSTRPARTRLPRDRRNRPERGRDRRHRGHGRARAHARLRRLDPGAEGGNHGDSGRDRRQQARPSRREDDGERGSLDPRARPDEGWRPPIVLTEALQGEGIDELWARSRSTARSLEENGLLGRASRPSTSPARCSRSRARARRRTSSKRSRTTPSSGGSSTRSSGASSIR